MPFVLLIIGLYLLAAGVRATQDTAFALIKGDFTGTDNFIYWLGAILIIGAIGYITKLKPISTALLVLVIVVLFLKKGNASGLGGGFFTQFASALGTTGSNAASSTSPITLAQAQQNVTNFRGAILNNIANDPVNTSSPQTP